MQQPYNINNRWKQPLLFLANPQKTYVKNGIIPYVKDLNLSLKFNNIKELSFKLYEYEDGVKNEFYDLIEPNRLIELQYLDWFQIDDPPETFLDNDKVPYKEIKCLSLENQLVRKRIDAVQGTYSLYDIADPEYSILSIVASLSGWSVGHIDTELLSLYRTFQVDTDMIYNFLTTTVSTSFDCIFVFDNYSKSISAYKLENIGEVTDIIISEKNLLNQCTVETYSNQIVTKMKVIGDDTCDIRAVNPNGTNYLLNVDYYLTKISNGGWMSDGLVDGWNNYKTAYANAQSTWTSLINTLKTKNSELTVLKAALTDLQSEQLAQSDVYSSVLQNNNGVIPPVGSSAYTIYINAWTSYNSYFALIATKQSQITAKETEISTTQSSLDSVSASIDISNFLTTGQAKELEAFLIEGDIYQDDTFVITDTMTAEEGIQMKLELMDNGAKQLAIYSHPQYTYKISSKNLFSIIDNPDNVCKFEDWRESLDIGNYVTIMLRDDYWVTTRIMEIDIDYNNLEEIQIVLSDKTREDTRTTQMSELLAGAGRTSAALSMYKYGYGQASGQVSDVRNFLTSSLNATLNSVVNNDNQDLLIDTYGLHMRKWLPDQNKYSDYQSWWLNNVLLFTDDGFHTATTAIGLLTAPDGSNYWGLNTQVLVGSLIMGERMILTNASGNYTWNNNGMTATATVGANTYLVGINPSTPSNIFRIAVNGVNKLYVDTTNNNLVFSGNLQAVGGTFSGVLSAATGTFAGSLQAASGTFTGTVSAGTIISSTITGSTLTSTGYRNSIYQKTLIQNGYITTNYVAVKPINGTTLDFSDDSAGYTFIGAKQIGIYNNGTNELLITNGDIQCKTIESSGSGSFGSLSSGGYNVLNINNYTAYCATSFHTHNTSDLIPADNPAGYILFSGGVKAAGYDYVNRTFQPISSSDFRLKKNIKALEELPIDLFMELKPYMYEMKCSGYGKGIKFGFIAQEVESAFSKYGLNAFDYNIVEISDKRDDIDEGQYLLDGKVHRVNYENFHSWNTLMIQKIIKRLEIK